MNEDHIPRMGSHKPLLLDASFYDETLEWERSRGYTVVTACTRGFPLTQQIWAGQ